MKALLRRFVLWLFREDYVRWPIEAFPPRPAPLKLRKHGDRVQDGDVLDENLFNWILGRIDRLEKP